MVLKWLRRMRLSARGDSRRHVGSAGHSLGFHEFPLLLCAGKSLLSKPTRKESPVRWGLFLFTKTSLSPSTLFSCAPPANTKTPSMQIRPHAGARIETGRDCNNPRVLLSHPTRVRGLNKLPPHSTQKTAHTVEKKTSRFVPFFLFVYQKCYIINTSNAFNRSWRRGIIDDKI